MIVQENYGITVKCSTSSPSSVYYFGCHEEFHLMSADDAYKHAMLVWDTGVLFGLTLFKDDFIV